VDIAIWGAGSVGLGLATTLAREASPLLVIGRDVETRHAIERDGLERLGIFDDRRIAPDLLHMDANPEVLVDAGPEWVLVCTKAFSTVDIAAALEAFHERVPERTKLVLCQNGWGNETPFLSFWPRERLFHARVITGFHRRAPNRVEVTAHASPIAFGSVFGHELGSLAEVAARIDEGGIPAETVADMRGVLWAKMLYNCALNPLGALAGRRYGELTENPTTRALVEEVIREIFAVLDAAGISVAWSEPEDYARHFHDELIPPTAQHESSMLQDLRAGRRTEIDALCGAVERLGQEVDVATPVVSGLAALVRAAERA